MDWERALNEWFVDVRVVGLLGSFWYAAAHNLVTALVLVWLYRRGAADYSRARPALVLALYGTYSASRMLADESMAPAVARR